MRHIDVVCMATSEEVYNSPVLDGIEAAQMAQYFEDTKLRSHQDHPASNEDGFRNAHRGDLMETLESRFDDRRQVEFAFMMMAEAYRLGGQ